jgi:hypothetical protein
MHLPGPLPGANQAGSSSGVVLSAVRRKGPHHTRRLTCATQMIVLEIGRYLPLETTAKGQEKRLPLLGSNHNSPDPESSA